MYGQDIEIEDLRNSWPLLKLLVVQGAALAQAGHENLEPPASAMGMRGVEVMLTAAA